MLGHRHKTGALRSHTAYTVTVTDAHRDGTRHEWISPPLKISRASHVARLFALLDAEVGHRPGRWTVAFDDGTLRTITMRVMPAHA